jgi:hypothetical protein
MNLPVAHRAEAKETQEEQEQNEKDDLSNNVSSRTASNGVKLTVYPFKKECRVSLMSENKRKSRLTCETFQSLKLVTCQQIDQTGFHKPRQH